MPAEIPHSWRKPFTCHVEHAPAILPTPRYTCCCGAITHTHTHIHTTHSFLSFINSCKHFPLLFIFYSSPWLWSNMDQGNLPADADGPGQMQTQTPSSMAALFSLNWAVEFLLQRLICLQPLFDAHPCSIKTCVFNSMSDPAMCVCVCVCLSVCMCVCVCVSVCCDEQ